MYKMILAAVIAVGSVSAFGQYDQSSSVARGYQGKLSSSTTNFTTDTLLQNYVPCIMGRSTQFSARALQSPDPAFPAVLDAVSQKAAEIQNDSTQKKTDQIGSNQQKNVQDFAATYAANANTVKDVLQNVAVTPGFSDTDKKKIIQTGEEAKNITLIQAPKGIGCSMSIYPWDLAHMIFGRTVADHYLAVQVVVRNLDQDHEFLIHDAELAVDAYSGQLERFQTSHEKQAVRGVVLYGQNYDRRAIAMHIVEDIGILLGAVIAPTVPFSDELTVTSSGYNSAVPTAMNKLFPDLSTQNLNNLNDLGFSAAAASRIVVPKGGSVPFVIFVPVKPLQQACWLQKGYVASADVSPKTSCDVIYTKSSDTEDAQLVYGYGRMGRVAKDTNPIGFPIQKWPLKLQEIKYKNWSPAQITALQKHAFAVVAGTHIQSVDAVAAVRSIQCQGITDANGIVLLASLSGQPLKCTVTGAALGNLTKIRLKDANTTPPLAVDMAVQTVASDSTAASGVISGDDLAKLTSNQYSVFGVDKSGNETDLKLLLHLRPLPTATAIVPKDIATFLPSRLLTITGTNLDEISDVTLAGDKQTISQHVSNVSQDGKTLTVTFPASFTPVAKDSFEVKGLVGGVSTTLQKDLTFQ